MQHVTSLSPSACWDRLQHPMALNRTNWHRKWMDGWMDRWNRYMLIKSLKLEMARIGDARFSILIHQ